MLRIGNADPVPPPPTDFLGLIEECRTITDAQVRAAEALDPVAPNIAETLRELDEARRAYTTALEFEVERAARLSAMREERDALRLAVADRDSEALRTGTPPDGEALRRLQAVEGFLPIEERSRKAGLDALREVAREYVAVATRAAAERALVLRLRIEPERLVAEAVLRKVQEIDSRVDAGRGAIDCAAVEKALRGEGLL